MRWLAGTLLGLLALAWAVLTLGAPSADVHPDPADPGPGGLSLLAKALRDKGRRVAFDATSRPRLEGDDVAVVPIFPKADEDVASLFEEGLRYRLPAPVLRRLEAGGRVLALGIPRDLQALKGTESVVDREGREAKASAVETVAFAEPPGLLAAAAVWVGDVEDPARLAQVGKGRLATLDAGALATNRFLGRADNARVVLETLDALRAPSDARVVFLSLGYEEPQDKGPIEAVGPWAVGALWQVLAVMAAFGVARGVRFGLSAPDATVRRGSRELLDVLAGHYRRARRTEAVLHAAARERPDDPDLQALAARKEVPEEEARLALLASDAKPRKRR